jgi:5-deoxy-glucuronate isomerase
LQEDISPIHSSKLPSEKSGELLHITRDRANWKWMSFFVRRLQPGELFRTRTGDEEAAFIVLGGTCIADWGQGARQIGKRQNVFDGFPFSLYVSKQTEVSFMAETACEIAECRVPSTTRLESKLITPDEVVSTFRGGGNASRQIVDILPPSFPADKLIVIEVYTPGGNWSSYPPHKHDHHNPPNEVDLDEIYYFRTRQPEGFAFQYLYGGSESGERILKAQDGDLVLVHSGYHSVVAGPGYDVYYLNFLAGSSRQVAVTEDPRHSWIRSTWPVLDPRLPIVQDRSDK